MIGARPPLALTSGRLRNPVNISVRASFPHPDGSTNISPCKQYTAVCPNEKAQALSKVCATPAGALSPVRSEAPRVGGLGREMSASKSSNPAETPPLDAKEKRRITARGKNTPLVHYLFASIHIDIHSVV